MMEFGIVAALALLLLSERASGDFKGITHPKAAKWLNARNTCLKTRSTCDLSVQRIEHGLFWDAVSLEVGQEYWIGARIQSVLLWQPSQSPLIEPQGCFQVPDSLQKTSRAQGPERCLAKCDGSYVALKGLNCYCLSHTDIVSFAQRPDDECSTFCNREPYRCGGMDNRVSIYKIPDRTLLQRSNKRGMDDWFWLRTFTNQNEHILLTNKPQPSFPNLQRFCASSDGKDYVTVDEATDCPTGQQPMSFENVNTVQFLQDTSSIAGMEDTRYPLPLAYTRQFLWLDGQTVKSARGKGDCVAITYDGTAYSLVKKRCKESLPFVCSCFEESKTTTTQIITEPTTTPSSIPSTTTTATEPPTSTTTQPPTTTNTEPSTTPSTTTTEPPTTKEPHSTTTEPHSTTTEPRSTTTEPPSTTTTTEPSTTFSTTTEQTSTPSTTVSTTSTQSSTTEPASSSLPTSPSMVLPTEKRMVPVRSGTVTAGSNTRSGSLWTSSSSASPEMRSSSSTGRIVSTAGSTPTVPSSKPKAREEDPDRKGNSTFLFKPHGENETGVSLSDDPAPSPGKSLSGRQDQEPATSALSIEMIIGITVGAVALMLVIIIIVVIFKRKRGNESSCK